MSFNAKKNPTETLINLYQYWISEFGWARQSTRSELSVVTHEVFQPRWQDQPSDCYALVMASVWQGHFKRTKYSSIQIYMLTSIKPGKREILQCCKTVILELWAYCCNSLFSELQQYSHNSRMTVDTNMTKVIYMSCMWPQCCSKKSFAHDAP